MFLELRQTAPVEILKIGVGSGQSEINVIEHARIARTRLARCSRHEPLCERRNRGSLVVVEERAMLLTGGPNEARKPVPQPPSSLTVESPTITILIS